MNKSKHPLLLKKLIIDRGNLVFIFLPIILFGFSTLILSCNQNTANSDNTRPSPEEISQGEKLARQYCQSCHMLPDPSWLDATTWREGVLPAMGPYLGIYEHNLQKYPSGRNDIYLDPGFYPEKPLMSAEEWQRIIDYFTASSSDSLVNEAHQSQLLPVVERFKVRYPPLQIPSPTSSLVHIDTIRGSRALLHADLFTRNLYVFDRRLKWVDSVYINAALVDIQIHGDTLVACDIGEINPNNKKLGSLNRLIVGRDGKIKADTGRLLTRLARPVQVSVADFNLDRQDDYLVCEFGFMTGSLSLFTRNNGHQSYTRQILRNAPGATKAYVNDYNHDGLPDIWVLFAQGEEGIFLFTNKGSGVFEEKQLLRFPPVYGSTFFELIDFNGDGHQDILYTCGDNADYSQILKPYHGIYLFINDGNNQFTRQYFYGMNGCFKALARDFDQDGDLDIAAISFFADYANHPDEGFVYLQHDGNFSFQPFRLPEGRKGRWLTMDAGDLNGDGLTDLVLGNFTYGPMMMKPAVDWTKEAPFLLLENIDK